MKPVVPLYDDIGENYDVSRRADPYIAQRLMYHLKASPVGRYLDLACGTGNYTLALRGSDIQFWGIDPSKRMIAAAHQKEDSIVWCLGTAEALPFERRSFSGTVCVLAIHHFEDMRQAFGEAARVLRCGRFVIFTATPEQMRGYWLNEYFPRAMRKSIEHMPSQDEIADALESAGFEQIRTEPYKVKDELEDFFLYSGKHRPEMYLERPVRMGISTFAAWAESDEIEEGCRRLEKDIQSGRINELIASYETKEGGDYLFVIGHKR